MALGPEMVTCERVWEVERCCWINKQIYRDEGAGRELTFGEWW